MHKKQLKAFIGLHRVVNHLDREVSKIHSKYDLTLGQFAVLEALYHKGDLCVGEVQAKILSSSGTMPVIVKNLESRGYLKRYTDDKDKRRAILSITEEGRTLMKKAYPENEEKIMEIMRVLDDEEVDALIRILQKWRDDEGVQK